MVELDPSKRITAAEALRHPFFTRGPAPTPAEQLPRPKRRADDPLALPPGQAPAGAKGPSSVVAEKRARGLDSAAAWPPAAEGDANGALGDAAGAAGGDAIAGSDGAAAIEAAAALGGGKTPDGAAASGRGSLSSDPGAML